jgi:hypothetical protein
MDFNKYLSAFVGHFCPPGSGSGSTDPIEYGSNPDPQPWLFLSFFYTVLHEVGITMHIQFIIRYQIHTFDMYFF